jgi:hypothetical protein
MISILPEDEINPLMLKMDTAGRTVSLSRRASLPVEAQVKRRSRMNKRCRRGGG